MRLRDPPVFKGRRMSRASFYGLCVAFGGIALLMPYLGYLYLGVPLLAIPMWASATFIAIVRASVDFGHN